MFSPHHSASQPSTCESLTHDTQAGKYNIQTRSEIGTNETHEVEESKVKELKVTEPAACPVVSG